MEENQSEPQKSKKLSKVILGIAIVVLVMAVGLWVFLGKCSKEKSYTEIPISLPNYSLENDYCGKGIDMKYCDCAFRGENCEMIGATDRESLKKLLNESFQSWLAEKKKEECTKKGGRWINDVCKK